MKKKIFFLVLSLNLGLLACAKKTDYLYYYNPMAPEKITVTQAIRDLAGTSMLDLMWVIGGMTEQADNFQTGIETFMQNFTKKTAIDWNMAVINTDPNDEPFLGMQNGVFNQNTPNASGVLVKKIMDVLNGNDGEKVFDPLVKWLDTYSSFARPGAVLGIIITNDATDSSIQHISAEEVANFLWKLKGSQNKVIVYGIFGSADFGCHVPLVDEEWKYHGSEFEKLINMTHGQALSLCTGTFGNSLLQITDNIIKYISNSRILLSKRPKLKTIHVTFQDTELPGGPKEEGGAWHYDYETNSIVFYDLNFATDDHDEISVNYTEDDGRP